MRLVYLLFAFSISGLPFQAFSQVFYHYGDSVSISANDTLFIGGEARFGDDAGVVNNGSLFVKGDFNNLNGNPQATIFGTDPQGEVILSGGAQSLGGNTPTYFNKLVLQNPSPKTLTEKITTNRLVLNDAELALQNDTFNILTPTPNALIRTIGTVNTGSRGILVRSMSVAGDYGYPFGANINGQLIYRPAEILYAGDSTGATNRLGGRFNPVDLNTVGYFRDLKDSSICKVNSTYYHSFNPIEGGGFESVKFYLDALNDTTIDRLLVWNQDSLNWKIVENQTQASALNAPIAQGGGLLKPISISAVNSAYDPTGDNVFAFGALQPLGTFTMDPELRVLYNENTFFHPKDVGNFSYVWDFGNGETSTESDPLVIYKAVGPYKVKLTVVNNNNPDCFINYEKEITVEPNAAFLAPDAFSPNFDGVNDQFIVHFYGMFNMTLDVYARRGAQVFHGTSLTSPISWDGTFNGDDLSEGVFIYHLTGQAYDGRKIERNGTITLLK